jgi:hypothetical protein
MGTGTPSVHVSNHHWSEGWRQGCNQLIHCNNPEVFCFMVKNIQLGATCYLAPVNDFRYTSLSFKCSSSVIIRSCQRVPGMQATQATMFLLHWIAHWLHATI